ncbi:MAG TPA: S-layer homology domain-containing protein, partial [Candidatus Evtepia faecigallinarum]|nr:S-layer homology domain-containing protein [Candidatus Evtepia faecigallinarum]
MGVSMNSGSVPVDIINAVTGEVGTMQLSLAHEGEFGFTLTLTAPLGSKNAGYWANLYYYNEAREKLEFQTSARIGEDGSAALVFTHASDYVIVIDDRDHTPKEFPFVDVTESDWFYEAVDYVFQRDLMNGTDSTHFTPDGTSSRAMVATILWRMAGEPQVNYAMDFADVSSGTWYTEAVRWAASEGIVTGYSDT